MNKEQAKDIEYHIGDIYTAIENKGIDVDMKFTVIKHELVLLRNKIRTQFYNDSMDSPVELEHRLVRQMIIGAMVQGGIELAKTPPLPINSIIDDVIKILTEYKPIKTQAGGV